MLVFNFTNAPWGMLVTYSEHYNKERCIKSKRRKIGIMTDKKFFNDTLAGISCHPVVFWEGAVTTTIAHPANIVPYRKKQILPTVDVDP